MYHRVLKNFIMDLGKQEYREVSINSITNSAAARRLDMTPVGMIPTSLGDIACAAQTRVTAIVGGEPATHSLETKNTVSNALSPPSGVDTALHVIFGFVPTEVLTLYVSVLAALSKSAQVSNAGWYTFFIFLTLTPVVVWLVFASKLKAAGKTLPIAIRCWPIWEMLAATIAFAVWAFALPNSPFSAVLWYSPAISGVLVLIASTFLGLLAPLVQRQLPTN